MRKKKEERNKEDETHDVLMLASGYCVFEVSPGMLYVYIRARYSSPSVANRGRVAANRWRLFSPLRTLGTGV